MVTLSGHESHLLQLMQRHDRVFDFFDEIFAFLCKRTDFFIKQTCKEKLGFPEGMANYIVAKAFMKYEQLAGNRESPIGTFLNDVKKLQSETGNIVEGEPAEVPLIVLSKEPLPDLKENWLGLTDFTYTCSKCNKKFRKKHVSKRTSGFKHNRAQNTSNQYSCKFCNKTYSKKVQWKGHIKQKHSEISTAFNEAESSGLYSVEKDNCNGSATSTEKCPTSAVINGAARSCTECAKVFPNISRLKQHMLKHTDERPHICTHEGCNKSFKDKNTLERHTMTHFGIKSYVCSTCGKLFSQIGSLNLHMRIHIDDRQFKCSQCPKSFRQKSHLQKHLRTHSGERPFQCELCGKSFPSDVGYKYHMRVHSGDKPYQCEYCGLSFRSSTKRREHTQRHHPDIARNQGINYNFRIKHYKCETCAEEFRSQVKLQTHKKMSHGTPIVPTSTPIPSPIMDQSQKVVSCWLCKEEYSSLAALTHHMQQCHPVVPFSITSRVTSLPMQHPQVQ